MNPCPDRETRGARSIRLLAAILFALFQSACPDPDALIQAGSLESAPGSEVRLRVRIDPVRMASLSSSAHVTGTVRAFHHATITAETQGRVLRRHVEAGATASEGSLLIELESSRLELEVRRAVASLDAAQTVLAHAKRDYGRAEQLIAQKAMSSERFDDLQHAVDRARDEIALAEVARDTAIRNREDAHIRAPFAGTVDALMVDVGDFVKLGTAVATLVDLSRVRIFAGVTAREAAYLESGATAQVSFADLGGTRFEATLQSVGRVAGSSDGTYDIELWMDPDGTPMRDGLVAQIELPYPNQEPSLLARRAAILRRDGNPAVFVVEHGPGGSIARSRNLRTGRSEGDWIEVLDGLEVGDQVVWDGHFALDDGSRVIVDGEQLYSVAADSPE